MTQRNSCVRTRRFGINSRSHFKVKEIKNDAGGTRLCVYTVKEVGSVWTTSGKTRVATRRGEHKQEEGEPTVTKEFGNKRKKSGGR